jgi:arylsulfatase A-like enzyme
MDLCPTILDLAGIKHPAVNGKQGIFRGRPVAPMRGVSWVSPAFLSTVCIPVFNMLLA